MRNTLEQVPQVPYVLFVEPTNICNMWCVFCPEVGGVNYQKQVGYYKNIELEVWQKLLQELKEWPTKPRVLRLYDVGEPLLNLKLPQMIRQTRSYVDKIEITINGTKLNNWWVSELCDSGLDQLRVSVYGTSMEDYKRQTGRSYKPHLIIDEVSKFKQYTKRPHLIAEFVGGSPEQTNLFINQWTNVVDDLKIKTMHTWGSSLVQFGPAIRKPKLVCPFLFYQLVIKPNGLVTVCCVDWDNQLSIGNIKDNTLLELWNGPGLKKLRELHLGGLRHTIPQCKDCTALESGTPDNLDHLVQVNV
jgi:radical SAM protein with 4Fe4S-binding SPASM domain